MTPEKKNRIEIIIKYDLKWLSDLINKPICNIFVPEQSKITKKTETYILYNKSKKRFHIKVKKNQQNVYQNAVSANANGQSEMCHLFQHNLYIVIQYRNITRKGNVNQCLKPIYTEGNLKQHILG